jgi:transposase
MSVVDASEGFSEKKHGASILWALARNGFMGVYSFEITEKSPRRNGKESRANRCYYRCPDCKKWGKRGDLNSNAIGYDGGKKIKGRKRHRAVDTQGNMLETLVSAASVQDRDGAKPLLQRIKELFPTITKVWADGGYAGKLVEWAKNALNIDLEIVKKLPDLQGFHVLPRRWVVERSFAWTDGCRRLSKDYERKIESSRAFNLLASIRLMVNNLAS